MTKKNIRIADVRAIDQAYVSLMVDKMSSDLFENWKRRNQKGKDVKTWADSPSDLRSQQATKPVVNQWEMLYSVDSEL